MFAKILIANRGEIACRIINTVRRLGLRSVAVYSAAEREARHVRLADEAILIGPAPASESYLAGRRIIEAALATGAQAIHPGYGFLSENADFAQACADAGLTYIGPPVAAMRAMGSKSAAKALMAAHGVPLLPGYHGDNQEPQFLLEKAQEIGYPLLIKAAAGGGGKGMRLAAAPGEFLPALASCRREAQAGFGSERVILERYLERARHIEVQVFADTHGNIVHLFERDCSLQRRHQKLIEEAPAPGMNADYRAALTAAALTAAGAAGYQGAGTVEFLAEHDLGGGKFYFIEMNTRLQVEHPVTEMITGLDLVEWQIIAAAGEPLPLSQGQLDIRGHALEARIYAEDPARGFLPSTGRLAHLAMPQESLNLRIDSGVDQGDEITPHYDALLAKLVVWDETRDRARARLLQALSQCRIVGVANNVGFLSRLVACPSFAAADLDTGFIEREDSLLFSEPAAPAQAWLVAALAELLREAHVARDAAARDPDPHSPWHVRDGWRLNGSAERILRLRDGSAERSIGVAYLDGAYDLSLPGSGQASRARGELAENSELRVELDGVRLPATVVVAGLQRHVFLHGRRYLFVCVDPLYHLSDGGGDGGLAAPMPGKVVALMAAPGKRVAQGAPLVVLEAMKMEHTLAAPAAGIVKRFLCAVGDQVEDGIELVDFEPDQ